jgi:hypothetical protein
LIARPKAILALLALASLAGVYAYVFLRTFHNPRMLYAFLACTAVAIVLAGPLYAYLRHKARTPWPVIIVRTLLVGVFTAFATPIVTAAGLFFGAMGIGYGLTILHAGDIPRGALVLAAWTFAFFGLITLWSLARHFWSRPLQNPEGAQLRRNLIGLGGGLVAIPALWLPAVAGKDGFAGTIGLMTLLTIPPAVVLGFLLGWNALRTRPTATQ